MKSFATAVACALLLGLPAAVHAQTAADLYAAQVEIPSRSEQNRQAGIRAALGQVLVKVTGRGDAATHPIFESVRAGALDLMQQWTFVDPNGLWAAFDAIAINRALLDRQLPRWGGQRPRIVVWLALEDEAGGAARLLGAQQTAGLPPRDTLTPQDPSAPGQFIPLPPPAAQAPATTPAGPEDPSHALLRERLQRTAEQRGIPFVLPGLDGQDLSAASQADLCGETDPQPLSAVSQRYQAPVMLTGCARLLGDTAVVRWTLFAGGDRWTWLGGPEEGLHQAVDVVAEAMSAQGGPLNRVQFRVDGVGSLAAYGRLDGYLDGLALISSVNLDAVEGDSVHVSVQMWGDAQRLQRALAVGGVLVPVLDGVPADEPPRFQLQFP